LAECGTFRERAQQEIFLHQRGVLARAHARAAAGASEKAVAAPATEASTNRDIGQIAVIDDSGGVVSRRNLFNLDRRTLVLQPSGTGFQVQLGGDTFDDAAAQAGTPLAGLGDDDARQIALAFTFPFFGGGYQALWVDSNGLLTFTGPDIDYSGSYGHFVSGLPAIAGLFTDLDPSQSFPSQSSGGARVLAEAARVVVTWSQIPLAGSTGLNAVENFQMRLYPDGHIELAYHAMDSLATLVDAVVGVTPGGFAAVSLADFASVPSGTFEGVAEVFASSDGIDVVAAAQKFYQTHDDAYDYLVFYNAESVAAGPGVVAYELTTRSHGQGYGDVPTEIGAEFGSPRRLKAVLNLGPLSEYPSDPNAPVPSRYPTGDTPLTLLGHEAGHLYLALVSVPGPNDPNATPMLGRGQVHWAFPFNSDASFLEGNRIADAGAGASPRFLTTATVEHYSALDEYLMGFRPPDEVAPSFAVLNSGQPLGRAPQTGVGFNGTRLEISIADIIQAAGVRIPDSTVAQRQYRFAFVVIVPQGADLASSGVASAVAQADAYRSQFEGFFAAAADHLASAGTELQHSAALSLSPAAGVIAGATGMASIQLAQPAASALTFTLSAPNGVLSAPETVTIPAGSTRVDFQTSGLHAGVEEFTARPSDPNYETAVARVQVETGADLGLQIVSEPDPLVLRVVDHNGLPYSNVPVAAASAGVTPSSEVTDEAGAVSFQWTPAGSNMLAFSVAGHIASVTVPVAPVIAAVVNAASYGPALAPGAFGTIFGTNFSSDAKVFVNGSPATVVYASAAQINFLAPANLLAGSAQVTVADSSGTSTPVTVVVNAYAPGIFYNAATGNGAIRQVGNALEIYCTGLGAADKPVTVQVGGLDAPILYSGPSSVPGLDQVNVSIPAGLSGTQPLFLSLNGIASNTVNVVLAP
jgi:uncharacterized protein (TIGR03437 family)